MATTLTWLGHGSWSIKAGSSTVLLDPFLDESPTAPLKAADVDADSIRAGLKEKAAEFRDKGSEIYVDATGP